MLPARHTVLHYQVPPQAMHDLHSLQRESQHHSSTDQKELGTVRFHRRFYKSDLHLLKTPVETLRHPQKLPVPC